MGAHRKGRPTSGLRTAYPRVKARGWEAAQYGTSQWHIKTREAAPKNTKTREAAPTNSTGLLIQTRHLLATSSRKHTAVLGRQLQAGSGERVGGRRQSEAPRRQERRRGGNHNLRG